jgi:hypothetical protein
VGYVASLFFHTDAPRRDLTIYGWLDKRREAAGQKAMGSV